MLPLLSPPPLPLLSPSFLTLISLSRYFDFDKLYEVTRTITRNLNKIIDVNYYPVETAKRSNLRHRPIGIGCQGLADAFLLLGMPFDSPEAQQLNKEIFECIYYAALDTSCELAKVRERERERGGPYCLHPYHLSCRVT